MSPTVFRMCKIVSITGGSVVSIIGILWSLIVVNSLSEDARKLKDNKDTLVKEVASINSASSEYFLANQQGDLIYVLAIQDSARKDIVKSLYQGNLLDRATPVRNMIGELAIARQLDYKETYNVYVKLNDEARQTMDFTLYSQLKNQEKGLIEQGANLIPTLLEMQSQINMQLNANEAAQKSQRTISSMFSILGTLLLLLANLIVKREEIRA